jgi:hypothetical protein
MELVKVIKSIIDNAYMERGTLKIHKVKRDLATNETILILSKTNKFAPFTATPKEIIDNEILYNKLSPKDLILATSLAVTDNRNAA